LLTNFAGTPATIEKGSTSFVTTLPTAINEPVPILTPGKITLRAPIQNNCVILTI